MADATAGSAGKLAVAMAEVRPTPATSPATLRASCSLTLASCAAAAAQLRNLKRCHVNACHSIAVAQSRRERSFIVCPQCSAHTRWPVPAGMSFTFVPGMGVFASGPKPYYDDSPRRHRPRRPSPDYNSGEEERRRMQAKVRPPFSLPCHCAQGTWQAHISAARHRLCACDVVCACSLCAGQLVATRPLLMSPVAA